MGCVPTRIRGGLDPFYFSSSSVNDSVVSVVQSSPFCISVRPRLRLRHVYDARCIDGSSVCCWLGEMMNQSQFRVGVSKADMCLCRTGSREQKSGQKAAFLWWDIRMGSVAILLFLVFVVLALCLAGRLDDDRRGASIRRRRRAAAVASGGFMRVWLEDV